MYSKINKCRACDHKKLSNLLDLGNQPLANALLKNKKNLKKEIKIPLELCMCDKCKLIQLKHTVSPKILFQKYFHRTIQVKYYFLIYLKKNVLDTEAWFILIGLIKMQNYHLLWIQKLKKIFFHFIGKIL